MTGDCLPMKRNLAMVRSEANKTSTRILQIADRFGNEGLVRLCIIDSRCVSTCDLLPVNIKHVTRHDCRDYFRIIINLSVIGVPCVPT